MYRECMIRTTVSISDDVGEILKHQAKVNGTNLAAEIAKAAEDAVWRIRIADHGRWLEENPEVAEELNETMMLFWNQGDDS